MRRTILALVPAICLLLPPVMSAQGTLYLSNLGETSAGTIAIGSDAWVGERFTTGTNLNGYLLDSVQLLMSAASGSPSNFSAMLYNDARLPTSRIGDLNGPDPTTDGIFTYTASDITLAPSTSYWIVLTAASPVGDASYNWSFANTSNYNSSNGWILMNVATDYYASSSDGLNWNHFNSNPLQFSVYATVIPEPAILALAGLGLATLSFRRRKS